MKYERASIDQRLAALLITAMLSFAVTNLAAILLPFSKLSYIAIVVAYIFILLRFYTYGSTPGKYIMRIQVIHTIDNHPAKFLRMFCRETIGKMISGVLYIGFIYALFNPEQKTFHDIICKTRVIKITTDEHIL